MSPDIVLLDSAQLRIFILDEKVLFTGLIHSMWRWLTGSKLDMFVYVYIYVCMYECVYLGA